MRIAILSRNKRLYSTNRLVEAAKERGHEVIVIDHLACSVLSEIGHPKIFYNGKELTDIDAVIPRIGASVTFYGTAVVRQFEMMGVFIANPSIAIVRSRDKLRSLQIFSKHGIPFPTTAFANHPKDIDNLIQQVGGAPLVIKLLEGTQGIGVVLAETHQSAKSVIEAFWGLDTHILIQEFIKEAKGADIRAFVVNGRIVGAMIRQGESNDFRSNLHRGGTSTVAKLSKKEKAVALAAAKAMGLSVCGVDLLRSARGPLIMEVNSSPGLQGIENTTKLDIAGAIIDYVVEGAEGKKKIDKIGA